MHGMSTFCDEKRQVRIKRYVNDGQDISRNDYELGVLSCFSPIDEYPNTKVNEWKTKKDNHIGWLEYFVES